MQNRVLIVYNEPVTDENDPEAYAEWEVVDTAKAVSDALLTAGFEVESLGVGRDPNELLTALQAARPDGVFNLFEGTADSPDNEACIAAILEQSGVPFTGCAASALELGLSKHRCKARLRDCGLPTPDFLVVKNLPIADCHLTWPVIVKPSLQDASVGIDQGSVVTNAESLHKRAEYLLQNYGGTVLVEQFIAGREFSVTVIESPEMTTLPILEIVYGDCHGGWPILTYEAKWSPDTPDYDASVPKVPADIPPQFAKRLTNLACEAFRLLDCRDCARIDFRVTPEGEPYILEVNPNPDLSPLACIAGMLKADGRNYGDFIVGLMQRALDRGRPLPAEDRADACNGQPAKS